jgi:ubiquinone/menaquinone biosynthesis C-methylase UbiE
MKKILRKIKRFFDRILGDYSDEIFWKYVHFFKKEWKEAYEISDYYQGHKKFLIDLIINDKKINKILELGCGDGINLRKIAYKNQSIELTGLDINKVAIKKGYLKIKNLNYKINLIRENFKNLKKYSNDQFDVVFSEAALMYVDKNNIHNVLKEALRISKVKVVICEQHTNNESYYDDKWVHNYELIFKKISSDNMIKIYDLEDSNRVGDWKKFGKIIEVKKKL